MYSMTTMTFDASRLGPPAGARVAVVGGCGGMGREVVRALRDTGVQVVVLDLPASLAQHPVPEGVHAIEVDGSDAASVQRAFAELSTRWSVLDGFVNLAGFFKGFVPIRELPVEVFDEVIAGNLRNHYLCARAALPLLRARGGGASLVSVASTMAADVVKNYAHYGAAKAGIVALVKGMARENAPAVRVNAIAPGLTHTAFLLGGTGRDQVFEGIAEEVYAKRVPMKRMAQPVDMVGPILFLLGPASAFVNGETLIVDGGVYTQ
ncbi:MAG: SDR family oxidoreductase [Betaproteobacteria bacterium]|nr:SDR family oxidoreductase [Betaproteobacteria bacterium]